MIDRPDYEQQRHRVFLQIKTDLDNWKEDVTISELKPSKKFIIECQDNGKICWVMEGKSDEGPDLMLTDRKEQATIYYGELNARCTLVYVADHHQPKLKEV